MSRLTVFSILFAFALAGCKSIKSTMLQRDEFNMGWQTIKSDGIPITLKVPTHFRIAIVDVRYAQIHEKLGWTLLSDRNTAVTAVQVDHGFIYTEKVFTVDPKRPAAGDIDFTIDLAENDQYIDKITSDITDRTIQETSAAFEKIFLAFKPGSGVALNSNLGTATNPLAPLESVRAMDVFEIDDPCFEQNVSAFLTQHFCRQPQCNNIEMIGGHSPIDGNDIPVQEVPMEPFPYAPAEAIFQNGQE